jgi:hypothetical protein
MNHWHTFRTLIECRDGAGNNAEKAKTPAPKATFSIEDYFIIKTAVPKSTFSREWAEVPWVTKNYRSSTEFASLRILSPHFEQIGQAL